MLITLIIKEAGPQAKIKKLHRRRTLLITIKVIDIDY